MSEKYDPLRYLVAYEYRGFVFCPQCGELNSIGSQLFGPDAKREYICVGCGAEIVVDAMPRIFLKVDDSDD